MSDIYNQIWKASIKASHIMNTFQDQDKHWKRANCSMVCMFYVPFVMDLAGVRNVIMSNDLNTQNIVLSVPVSRTEANITFREGICYSWHHIRWFSKSSQERWLDCVQVNSFQRFTREKAYEIPHLKVNNASISLHAISSLFSDAVHSPCDEVAQTAKKLVLSYSLTEVDKIMSNGWFYFDPTPNMRQIFDIAVVNLLRQFKMGQLIIEPWSSRIQTININENSTTILINIGAAILIKIEGENKTLYNNRFIN